MLKAKQGRSHGRLTHKTITDQLDRLLTRDAQQLRALWPEQFGRLAPPYMQREMLLRILAYDVQVRVLGGVSKSVAKNLDRVAAEEFGELDDNRTPTRKHRLTPGMRLVRDWHGVTHEVCVTEKGFLWGGNSYRSLSAVARPSQGRDGTDQRSSGSDQKATRDMAERAIPDAVNKIFATLTAEFEDASAIAASAQSVSKPEASKAGRSAPFETVTPYPGPIW